MEPIWMLPISHQRQGVTNNSNYGKLEGVFPREREQSGRKGWQWPTDYTTMT
jgi:hypothetical protein